MLKSNDKLAENTSFLYVLYSLMTWGCHRKYIYFLDKYVFYDIISMIYLLLA